MCNDYEQHIRWSLYKDAIEKLNTAAAIKGDEDKLILADDIRVGELGPVVRAAGNGVEVSNMVFGFPPPKPKRPRTFNFISEKRDFSGSKRCGVLASAFFEFTGKKYPKAKHRFTLNDQPFLFVAGLWREGNGEESDSFTMLTTSPGPDIEPYHDRQIVVLAPRDLEHWLYLTKPRSELLRPLPAGSLSVETVFAGSD